MENGFTQSAPGAAQNVQSGPNWNDLAEKEKTWRVLDEVVLFCTGYRFLMKQSDSLFRQWQSGNFSTCLVLYFRTELFINYD